MTYYRVSLNGTLPGGEVWSINPQFATSTHTPPSPTDLAAAATGIGGLALPLDLSRTCGAAAKLNRVRVEERSDSGVLLQSAEAAYTGTQGSSAAPTSPGQTAVVLSLRTNTPGARGRGRLYWPAVALQPSAATLRIATADRDAIATAAVTYLRAVQDALKDAIAPAPSAATFELAVFSGTTGTHSLVNRILVGDVFDSQRRRRDRLVESYTTRPFPS